MPLETLQRWMFELVTDPAPLDEVLLKTKQTAPELVANGPGGLSGREGLEIYRRMYLARFEEVLAIDHGALVQVLGPARWEALVSDYVAAHPSTSWTMARVGDLLPQFMSGWCAQLRKPKWWAELAHWEHQVLLAEEAPAGANLTPEALAQVTDWGAARLLVNQTVFLGDYHHQVVEVWAGRAARPARRRQWVAAHRRQGGVEVLALERRGAIFLRALAAGQTLAEALFAAFPRPRSADAQRVQAWLQDWTAQGIFAGVSV